MTASQPQREQVAARRQRVLQLRRSGLPFAEIARQTGLPNARAAATDLRRALKAQAELLELVGPFDAVMEGERLDAWQRHLEAVLANASGGGESRLADPGLVIRCVGRLLEIQRCRLALMGIDVPADVPDELEGIRASARAKLHLIPGGA